MIRDYYQQFDQGETPSLRLLRGIYAASNGLYFSSFKNDDRFLGT